tara:strand:- start:785 stop:1249 length:465 start_codon:yes stop_codon:yes gene_type:complete
MRSRKRLKQNQTDPRICSVLYRRALAQEVLEPKSFSRRTLDRAAIALVFVAVSGSFSGMIFGASRKFQLLPTIYTMLILLGLAFLLFQIYNWIATPFQRRRTRRMKEALRELPAYCAGCWYPLGDQTEHDGCTVCPECGGAWLVGEMSGTSTQE